MIQARTCLVQSRLWLWYTVETCHEIVRHARKRKLKTNEKTRKFTKQIVWKKNLPPSSSIHALYTHTQTMGEKHEVT